MRSGYRTAVFARRAALALAGTALAGSAAFAAPTTTPCSALNGQFPNGGTLALSEALGFTGPGTGTPLVLAIQAQDVPANALSPGEPSPALCSVGAVIASNGNPAQSQIQIAVLLPEGTVGTNTTGAWNGRFVGTGNGGFAGSIASSTLGLVLIPAYSETGKTYVVANTDMGDGTGVGSWYNCNTLWCGSQEGATANPGEVAGGLYGNPVAITDFAYGATHLMTVAAKALISSFYGSNATYSYFHGCSTGGQQALMEAQRFPTDYDGIVAGSPAWNRTHLHIASASFYETVFANGGAGILGNAALEVTHLGMLAACAGHDGGLPTDNYLNQPAHCSFDATALMCTGASGEVPCSPTSTSCSCLTPAQAASANAAWTGALDNHGHVLYPGYERGVEDPYAGVIGEQESLTEPLFDSLDYWAFGPSFNWQSLFKSTATVQGMLSTQIAALDNTPVGASTFEQVLNASSPDLTAFKAHGGKLIMYAGYEDPLIPTASTIDYYNAIRQGDPANTSYTGDPDLASYTRLYLAPGVWHCNGGPGANAFGNLSPQLPPVPGLFSDDVLGATIGWREAGLIPTSILATKYVNDDSSQGVAFQRPLCPYPKVAHDKHPLQNPLLASSWECYPGPYVENQKFTPIYGPQ